MWFSTPCNPSGSVYNREELTALAKVLEKHHMYTLLPMKSMSTISQGLLQHRIYPGMLEKTITVKEVAKLCNDRMENWLHRST
jgi:aspartate aminotransferase